MLKELDRFKSLCYKPLTNVFTYHSSYENHAVTKNHVYSCEFLKAISGCEIKYTLHEHITPIEEIHEEIRRILNEKKDSKK